MVDSGSALLGGDDLLGGDLPDPFDALTEREQNDRVGLQIWWHSFIGFLEHLRLLVRTYPHVKELLVPTEVAHVARRDVDRIQLLIEERRRLLLI